MDRSNTIECVNISDALMARLTEFATRAHISLSTALEILIRVNEGSLTFYDDEVPMMLDGQDESDGKMIWYEENKISFDEAMKMLRPTNPSMGMMLEKKSGLSKISRLYSRMPWVSSSGWPSTT